ncbi:hypothetical protein FOL46_008497 [Perkinsus olseni]|uniref:Uncharacterized protein n=1 Tax=Perkinsus olseni TaxID=32597 RepID=A0A7J6L6P2_PEROL|nr:hypothetical protein FOL46_008497 [Perkinsus olseni]
MVLVHADAFLVNDTAVSLGRSTPLRALRLPVEAEQLPKCLPPADQFGGENYCWFILKDSPQTQVHSGMLIRSNTSHTSWYATLELIVLAPPDSLPTDVGIWAEGYTFLKLFLPKGITVDLTFYVPRCGAVGGKDVGKDEKEIEFKVELTTAVNVPGMDALKANGENFASASIFTSGGMNQIFADVTAQGSPPALHANDVLAPIEPELAHIRLGEAKGTWRDEELRAAVRTIVDTGIDCKH